MGHDDQRPFTATQFVPIEGHVSAEEKADWADRFARFVEGGFREDHLTKGFYSRLHCLWDFIAHYDRHGFYHYYFARASGCRHSGCGCDAQVRAEGFAEFVSTVLRCPCYGDPRHTWSDVEKVVALWLRGWLLGHDRGALAAFTLQYRAYHGGDAVAAWDDWLVARMEALLAGDVPPAAPRRIDDDTLKALRRPARVFEEEPPDIPCADGGADVSAGMQLPLFAEASVTSWARPARASRA